MSSQPLDPERNPTSLAELQRDAAWRRERVSIAAYYCAERRGFEPGNEDADWRLAEAQIDAADEAAE